MGKGKREGGWKPKRFEVRISNEERGGAILHLKFEILHFLNF
jgi:hypothetical protein